MLTQIAVDRSSDGVFWIDMDGCVFKVNDQACRSLGYSRDELVGMHIWDFDPNFVGSQIGRREWRPCAARSPGATNPRTGAKTAASFPSR